MNTCSEAGKAQPGFPGFWSLLGVIGLCGGMKKLIVLLPIFLLHICMLRVP